MKTYHPWVNHGLPRNFGLYPHLKMNGSHKTAMVRWDHSFSYHVQIIFSGFLGIYRDFSGFLRYLFLREKIPKTRPKYLGKKTSTKLLQVDLHAKHPLGAPLKIWSSIEINIDDGSNGQTLGTYPQNAYWMMNMDKYG